MDQHYTKEQLDRAGKIIAERFRPSRDDLRQLTQFSLSLGISNSSEVAETAAYELLGRSVEDFVHFLRTHPLPLSGPLVEGLEAYLPGDRVDLIRAFEARQCCDELEIGQMETHFIAQARRYASMEGDAPHVVFIDGGLNGIPELDGTAFLDGLIRFIGRTVRSALYTLGLPASEVDECVSNAIFNVYKSLPRFRGESTLSSWVHRVTWNVCLTRRGQLAKSTSSVPQYGDFSVIEAIASKEDLSAVAIIDLRKQLKTIYERAGLTPQEQALLEQYYGDGEGSRALGVRLDLAPSGVRIRVLRILNRIRVANGIAVRKEVKS